MIALAVAVPAASLGGVVAERIDAVAVLAALTTVLAAGASPVSPALALVAMAPRFRGRSIVAVALSAPLAAAAAGLALKAADAGDDAEEM